MTTLLTQFYRTSESEGLVAPRCPPITDANYSPYKLFCFRGWLYYWLRDTLGSDIQINYKDINDESKTHLGLTFGEIGNELVLEDDFKDRLNTIIKSFSRNNLDWVPVFYFNEDVYSNCSKIPSMWINSMLRYISLEAETDSEDIPILDESFEIVRTTALGTAKSPEQSNDSLINNRIIEYPAASSAARYPIYLSEIGLMINLKDNPEYLQVHAEFAALVRKTLIEYYSLGALVDPAEDFAQRWNLSKVNDFGLYQAMWSEPRVLYKYVYLTDFLISRIEGETDVTLMYPDDLQSRYNLALLINEYEYEFTIDGIQINVNDYIQLKDVLNKIEQALSESKDDIVLDVMYLESLSAVDQLDGGIIFKTDDSERPYTYVKIVPFSPAD